VGLQAKITFSISPLSSMIYAPSPLSRVQSYKPEAAIGLHASDILGLALKVPVLNFTAICRPHWVPVVKLGDVDSIASSRTSILFGSTDFEPRQDGDIE
jgi:hypothetical protein